jgi:PAS domain S-box-containing protein
LLALGLFTLGLAPSDETVPSRSTITPLLVPGRDQKKVLTLYSIGREMPDFPQIDQVLQRTMRRGLGERLDYYSEALDINRFSAPQYKLALYEFLRQRYQDREMNLIIAVGESASQFAAQYGAKLFPAVPVVVLGIAQHPHASNFTGFYQTLDMKGSFDLALRLQPAIRQVFVVSGSSDVDKFYLTAAQQQFQQFDGHLTFTYLIGQPLEDLRKTLTSLPGNSIIYYVTFTQDLLGNQLSPTHVLEAIAPVATAPIYGFNEIYLSHGLIGGRLLSPEMFAAQLGELALRVLGGEKPADIPITEARDTVSAVDWRELKRWRIDESRLPAGTTVRFKQPTFWEQYESRVIGAITLCVLQGVLIFVLLVERACHQRAKAQLDERLRFERLLLELSAEFASLPVGEIDTAIEKWVLCLKEFLGANNGIFLKLGQGNGGGGTDGQLVAAVTSSHLVTPAPESLEETGSATPIEQENGGDSKTHSLPQVPVVINGSTWTLTLANLSHDADRSEDLIPRLRLVFEIFAAAAIRKRQETALRESESKNRAILEALPDVMFLLDKHGVCLDYHAKSPGSLHVPPEKFLGKSLQEVLPPELAQVFALKLEEAAQSDHPVILEYALPGSGGECFYEARIARCADDKFLSVVRDVTVAKKAEGALLESQERYKLATGAGKVGVWDWDLQTGKTYVDPLLKTICGYEDDGVLEQYVEDSWRFIHPEDVNLVRQRVEAHLEGRLPRLEVEHRVLHRDGSLRWFRVLGQAVRGEDGRAVRLLGTTVDITERKNAEETLRKSEERLRLSLQAGRMGAWDWDVRSNAVSWSTENFSILGLDPSVAPSYQNWFERVHPADRPRVEETANNAVREGRDYECEYRLIWPDGSLHRVRDYARPVFDSSGACIAMSGLNVDVTERKRAEEELRTSEQRYRDVVETQTELICRYRPDTTLTFVNQAYCRFFGKTSRQLVGTKFVELIPEPDRPAALAHVASLVRNPRIQTNEHPVIKADGTVGWHQWIDHAIRNADGFVVELQGIGHDITDRKQVEDDLVQLSLRFLGLQDEERSRIGRELHDVTAQNLFAATLGLARLQQTKLVTEARDVLAECQALCEQSLLEIRTLSYRLHPPMLDQAGLVPALQWYIEGFAKRSGIEVDLVTPEEIERLPKEVEADLFRIVQEGLANVHRHSGSNTATVRLDQSGQHLALQIKDQGCGMSKTAMAQVNGAESLGVGIRGMRERLRQLGGHLQIESTEQGTTVTAVVPLSTKQASNAAAGATAN